ncbi:MAG: FKBP-type peptidyl-prolyl cis-trans isomerase [Flavobacteriales bacterium]|nr:FKBP-type peptidyl-prolyl cis-trans isomerase [Flavobacteriales bacterium]
MNVRLLLSAGVALLISACTDQAAGQKGHGVALKTNMDSVSYGIGTDIGHNMKQGGLDSLNVQAVAMGIQDGLDSTEKISSEKIRAVVQAYMLEAQKRSMAKQQAASEESLRAGEAWLLENGKKPGMITTPSGLQYEVLTAGNGAKPVPEDEVKCHYSGSLWTGKEFESSYKRGQPADLKLVQVIQGLTEGLQLMSIGSKYRFYIPQNLAWGAQGAGPDIPPYSAVIFEVELLGINGK